MVPNQLIGYADDLALVEIVETAVEKIEEWMEEQELELAPEKTEVVIFEERRKLTKMKVAVDGKKVEGQRGVNESGWKKT
mgnify:FL=1